MIYWWVQFVKTLWILFPAYAANGFPPLARGKRPLDFKKNFFDGKRILGDGKTIEGTLLGLIIGFLIGALETFTYPFLNAYAISFDTYLPFMSLFVGLMISIGTLVGDMASSFFKRRLNLPRGTKVILLDQLNFIIGTVVFTFWFTEITPYMILIMILMTPVIHRIANIVAYKLRLKKEPW
jgi:CDP-2,3-bis-(O-geranylgeranyl)-sn-glycerol synthase